MSLKELAPTYYTRLQSVLEEIGKPQRILNVGCGDGLFDRYLKKKVPQMASVDINRDDVVMARKLNPESAVFYGLACVENLPFLGNIFDCIICVDVIEHVLDDATGLREMVRCLKPGGSLIITVPSRDFPFFYDPINAFLRRFGKKCAIGIWGWGHLRLYTFGDLQMKTGLPLTKTVYLSKSLVGMIENSYLNSMFQKFTKTDPGNQNRLGTHLKRVEKTVRYEIPRFFSGFRDMIIAVDRILCGASTKSIGIMAVFQK